MKQTNNKGYAGFEWFIGYELNVQKDILFSFLAVLLVVMHWMLKWFKLTSLPGRFVAASRRSSIWTYLDSKSRENRWKQRWRWHFHLAIDMRCFSSHHWFSHLASHLCRLPSVEGVKCTFYCMYIMYIHCIQIAEMMFGITGRYLAYSLDLKPQVLVTESVEPSACDRIHCPGLLVHHVAG